MRNKIGLLIIILFLLAMVASCGVFSNLTGKANTIVFYGEEENVQEIISREQQQAVKSGQYMMKFVEQDDKKIIVLEHETAQALLEDDLWRKVNEKNKLDELKALPKIGENESILFSKEAEDELTVGENALEVAYGGNTILGKGQKYIDSFIIVPGELYEALQNEEQAIGYLRFPMDPSKKVKEMDVEYIQISKMK